jgi:hypothetical protein
LTEPLAIDAATRAALRARHLAWATARLSGEAGKAALSKNLEAGFRSAMATPVERAIDFEAVVKLIDHLASSETLRRTARPIVQTAVKLEMARLREEPTKLGGYVPEAAVVVVDRLLERPKLLPEKFVRELMTHRAFEEVMRDVLEDALREFGEKVDPFKAEWGLPSLMRKAGPLAMFAKGIDVVAREFEARLEPERRKFLQGFARRALGLTADFVVRRADDPPFLAARKELFRGLLAQPVSELVQQATEPVVADAEEVAHLVAAHVVELEATKRRRRAELELLYKAHAKEPLEAALARYGATIEPDFDAITDAVWPIVEAALASPAIEAFVDELVGGFYDALGEE